MSVTNNARPAASISILGGMAREVAAAGTTPAKREDRPPSIFWANIGITLEGAAEDGGDLFVSLPVGLALDDMKPMAIRGNKPGWIHLAQAKNNLLDKLKAAVARLEPGESAFVDDLRVQLYRKGEPEQVGTDDSNPLIAAMSAKLSG